MTTDLNSLHSMKPTGCHRLLPYEQSLRPDPRTEILSNCRFTS